MISPRIALVAIARTTFDIELAAQQTDALRARLTTIGYSLEGPAGLITDLEAAQSAAHDLSADPPDLLLVLQSTFADSTLVVALAEVVDAALLLWAFPEPRVGGRLRLNSLCGINLAGHALTLMHKPYDYIYAEPDDGAALSQLQAVAAAGRVRRLLRETRLGVVGEPPAGFESCHLDAPLLRETLGLQIERLELAAVFERAQGAASQTTAVRARLAVRLGNLAELDQRPLAGTLGVYTVLRQIAAERRLAGLAVRCWPEFFTELGCAACGALSMLSDELVPCSCEADVNGTVTQLILQWLSGEPAFGADLVAVDFDQDVAIVWHCGLAPLSMADPNVAASGGLHSNRKLPLVMDFPLKPGRVTVARLSRATGDLRMVVGGGEMLAAPPSFSGTSGTLRFDRPVRDVFDIIMGEGLEHHISLTYGDHVPALLALAKMLRVPVLRL